MTMTHVCEKTFFINFISFLAMNLFILNCEIILFIYIFISNINPSELMSMVVVDGISKL